MKQQTQINKIEWREVELESFAQVITGGTPSTTKKEYWENGTIPWLPSGDLKNKSIKIAHKFITESGLKNSSARMMPKNTVLIALTGATTGQTGFLEMEASANQSVTGILPSKSHYPKYLFYFLQTIRKKVISESYGGAQPHISQGYVKSLKIPLPFSNGSPDLKEQERIVKVLEKAEKQKERSKKAMELLDEYLKSIFNEMFYNKGFEIKKGKELFELAYGKGLSEEQRDNGKYPVYGSNGIVGSHSEFLVKAPGIIIGRKGSIGEVNFARENFWPIDTTYYIKPLKEINFIYLYYLLKSCNLKINNSTAIPGLNRNEVYSMSFIDSPLPLQQKFAKIVEQVEKMKENVNRAKQRSGELFNSLMSKAFKGEL